MRCAGASEQRNESLAGTASTVRAYLLVENPGPWGVDAVRDNRMPREVKAGLARAANAAKVRVLLIRRHHRGAPRHGFRVFAAYADPVSPWLETGVLEDAGDVLELDLAGLGAGRSAGLERTVEPLFCVCTHGRHDACCAERGRPVAASLAAAHPEATWEVSHIGGDRFAGNALVLPHGLYYGRLDAPSALTVAGAHLAGYVDLDHLRGRSGLPMPVQAAEIALRAELGETREASMEWQGRRSEESTTVARFRVGEGASYDVTVRSTRGPDTETMTCRALHAAPVQRHELVAITRVAQSGG